MVEEIILESRNPAALPSPPIGKARKLTAACLGRSARTKGAIHYRLFNKQYVEVQRFSSNGELQQNILFSVGFLSRTPKVQMGLQWPWMYLCVVCFLAAFVSHFVLEQLVLAISSIVTALFSGVFFVCTFKKCSVFFSKHSMAPLIVLPHSKKNSKAIAEMVEALGDAIKDNPLSKYVNTLAEETKLLREFCEKGFFTEKEYFEFRAKIFKKYSKG